MKCPECKTELINAAGIGPYCPNMNCPVIDDADLWDGKGNRDPKNDIYLNRVILSKTEIEIAAIAFYKTYKELVSMSEDSYALQVTKNHLRAKRELFELIERKLGS